MTPAQKTGRYVICVTPKPFSVPSGLRTWMCVTGEPCETERLMHGSGGGRRKSAPLARSNSPAAYPTLGLAHAAGLHTCGVRTDGTVAYWGGFD